MSVKNTPGCLHSKTVSLQKEQDFIESSWGSLQCPVCETSVGKELHALDFLLMLSNSWKCGETAADQEVWGQQEDGLSETKKG